MILDASGKPQQVTRILRVIEDVASFGYSLNLKNPDGSPTYETAKFFHSQKYQCEAEYKDDASREAYVFCEERVRQDIADFTEKRIRKHAARAAQNQRSVA